MLAIVAGMPRPLAELWELPEQRLRASQAADRIYRYFNQIPAVSQAVGREIPRTRLADDRLRGRLLYAPQQTAAARRH